MTGNIDNWEKDMATDAQRKKLFAVLNEQGIDKELFEMTARVDISTMLKGEMSKAIGLVEGTSKDSTGDVIADLGKWAATREDSPPASKPSGEKKAPEQKGTVTQPPAHREAQEVKVTPQQSEPHHDITSLSISGALSQIMSIDDALKVYDLFEDAKRKLLKASDYQEIVSKGRVIGRFIKKSGWKKIQTFFGVSTDVIDVQVLADEDGDSFAIVKARATWGGRNATETGIYTKKEMIGRKRPYNLSNLIATATTRANNRAVSAIVGGGEVSAEEMEGE